jgi:hypothetical protein
MKKHVRIAFIRSDKSKPFTIQKLLYCSIHCLPLYK